MNRDDKPRDGTATLITVHGVVNTALGVSLLLWSNINAESVLDRLFAPWFWPSMFILAGVLAFIGLQSRIVAQFSFAFAGIVMAVFGSGSLIAVITLHRMESIPVTIFLYYLAYLKFMVAGMIRQRESTIQQIQEATERGRNVLDKVTDGSHT